MDNLLSYFLIFDWANISFSRLWALLLLILPLLVYLISLMIKQMKFKNQPIKNFANKGQLLNIPTIHQLGFLKNYQSGNLKNQSDFFNWFLLGLIWILLVISFANPVETSDPISISRKARDVMMAVDLSHSMAAQDFSLKDNTVDRLSATKWVAQSFIKQREGDRVGLILFADRAFVQSPLTFDLKTIELYLSELQVGLVGENTAIGDAIALAAQKYNEMNENGHNQTSQDSENQSQKILILLTDGANNTGVFDPIEAANLAKEVGLKIYPISIGPDVIIGGIGIFRQQIPRSEYADEKTLKQVAQMTGGKHFFAGNTEELEQVYQLINDLEPINQDKQVFRLQSSQFYWPLSWALFLLTILIVRQQQKVLN